MKKIDAKYEKFKLNKSKIKIKNKIKKKRETRKSSKKRKKKLEKIVLLSQGSEVSQK